MSRKIPQYQILLRSLQRLLGWCKRTDSRKERFVGTLRRTANDPKKGSGKTKSGREDQIKKKQQQTSTLEMKVLKVFSVELLRKMSEVQPE